MATTTSMAFSSHNGGEGIENIHAADLTLSKGAINAFLENRVKPADIASSNTVLPLVQVLGSKAMANNRVRAVVYDGLTICQHCIIMHDEAERLFNEGRFEKYTVIRVRDFSVSSLPKKENTSVLLVSQVELVREGKDVGQKLEGADWSFLTDRNAVSRSMAVAPISTSSRPPLSPAKATPSTSLALASRPPLIVSKSPALPKGSAANKNEGGFVPPGTLQPDKICAVNIITPFYNSWVIRVRVTSKTPMKTYSNARGSGKLFSFDTVDESGEIRITAFNAEADKFYDGIDRDKVYMISKGTVKPANKKFSTLNADFELTLNNNSIIEPVETSDSMSLPRLRFKFVPLNDVEKLQAGTLIDVIGIIRSIGNLDTFTAKKTGKPMTKREVNIVDSSKAEARLTLWHGHAEAFAADVGEVIALKAVLVGDFQGKTLSTGGSTVIDLEPDDLPEKAVLRQWYYNGGSEGPFKSLCSAGSGGGGVGKLDRNVRFIGQLTTKLIQANADAANAASSTSNNNPYATPVTFSSIHGTISTISNRKDGQTHLYKSCASEAPGGCLKKVTDEAGDGLYYCAKCDRTSPHFKWRFMLSVTVADATSSTWVTIFQENAEKLLGGITADDLATLYERDPAEYSAAINRLRFTDHYLRLGTKMDDYGGGESRPRSSLYSIVPTGEGQAVVNRSRRLLEMIPKMDEQLLN